MASSPRYAGFWVRFIADLIDSILLTVAAWMLELMLLGVIYWIGHRASTFPASFEDSFNPLMLQIVNGGLYLVLAFPYYTWGHYRYGTTLGKKLFRVYVVNMPDRMPISLRQAVIRSLGYVVSYLPFCAGFLMAIVHPEKRALHDLMAGTVSISRDRGTG